MSATYNADAQVQSIQDLIAMDAKNKGEIYSRLLESSAMAHNAFEKFCSKVDPKTNQVGRGVRSIFAKKTDLRASGADTVNFNVIGPPGGPGVMGNEELTGNTSSPLLRTYPVRVGWHRDGFELTRDAIEFLSAGRSMVRTVIELLGEKMGLLKQNHMMMRLMRSQDGNIYRPNNKRSRNDLLPTDKLGLSVAQAARSRLSNMGGLPIFHKLSKTGSPIRGYLTFASDTAMLPVRNDDGYQTALAQGHNRGNDNANFTGELVDWSGMPWYELPTQDMAWDDYMGSPILPKAKLGKAFTADSAAADCKLITNENNTKSRYFQFFPGFDYKFEQDQSASPDSAKYYAWIINPDGSVGFVEYTGSGNNGNQITVDKILSKNGAQTSTKGATTVGEAKVNTVATPDAWLGDDSNLPDGFTYTDEFEVGAIILPANSKGTVIGHSFTFGAMAACYANGRIDMNSIEQTRDFGFTVGKGFETIFGTGVTKNPLGKPVGYLLIEHAVEHEGYPVPELIFA